MISKWKHVLIIPTILLIRHIIIYIFGANPISHIVPHHVAFLNPKCLYPFSGRDQVKTEKSWPNKTGYITSRMGDQSTHQRCVLSDATSAVSTDPEPLRSPQVPRCHRHIDQLRSKLNTWQHLSNQVSHPHAPSRPWRPHFIQFPKLNRI